MSAYDYVYREIGDRIQKCRTEKRLTQEDLAKQLDLTRTSIVHIEKGRQKVPLDKLYHMSEILEVDLYDLLPPIRKSKDRHGLLNSQVDIVSRKRFGKKELSKIISVIEKEGEES